MSEVQLCKDCESCHQACALSAPQCRVQTHVNWVSGHCRDEYCHDVRTGPICGKFKKKEKVDV